MSAALEFEALDVAYTVRGKDRQVLRGALVPGRGGRDVRARRRVRLRQVDRRARGGPLPAAQRQGRGRRSINVAGNDVLALSGSELRQLRADSVSMVYQNPGAALNPSLRVGAQVAEAFTVRGVPRGEAHDRARDALARVQIADPGSVMDRYSASSSRAACSSGS